MNENNLEIEAEEVAQRIKNTYDAVSVEDINHTDQDWSVVLGRSDNQYQPAGATATAICGGGDGYLVQKGEFGELEGQYDTTGSEVQCESLIEAIQQAVDWI